MSKTKKYNVVKIGWGGSGKTTHVSGPHSWPIAWRKASKLNNEAREAFRTGRSMYDVPEFGTEEISEAALSIGAVNDFLKAHNVPAREFWALAAADGHMVSMTRAAIDDVLKEMRR